MRFRTRVGASMAAVTLTGLAATGLFTFFQVNRTIHSEAERKLLEDTSALLGEWRGLSNEVSAAVQATAHAADLKTELSRLARDIVPAESREVISLARRLRAKTQLNFLEILDERGVVLSNGHWNVFYGRPDPEAWDIVQRTAAAPAAHWRNLKGQRSLALETSARLDISNRVFHIVGGKAITAEDVSQMGRSTEGTLYLQMQDGTRILPPGVAAFDIEHLYQSRLIERGDLTALVGRASWREPAGVSLTPIRGPNNAVLGHFVFKISQTALLDLSRKLPQTFAWIGLLGVGAAWIFGFWLARRITRPVEELAKAAARVGVGRSPGPMPRITPDEVGELVRSFQQMTWDLAESRSELVRAERIAAWREIAQRMAHEIKNALSPIQMSMETVLRGHRARRDDFEEILAEAVQTVQEQIQVLRKLINEFSQFARMPELKLEPGSLRPVQDRVALLHQLNPQGVRVSSRFTTPLPAVAMDADALGRALGNVVLNAVEASPAGGEVAICSAVTTEGSVEILVDDQGPGIPPEAREKVFEPYYSTKDGGTGLGLAMAFKIVLEHGGRIEIHDRPGGGGRFRILLPSLAEKPAGQAKES